MKTLRTLTFFILSILFGATVFSQNAITLVPLEPHNRCEFESGIWLQKLKTLIDIRQAPKRSECSVQLDSIVGVNYYNGSVGKRICLCNDTVEIIADYSLEGSIWIPTQFRKYEFNSAGLISEYSRHAWDGAFDL